MKEIVGGTVLLVKAILIMAILFLAASCSNFPPLTKNGYIKYFIEFVNDVELNHEKYTAEDWKKADEKFEKYADKYYVKFKDKMDNDEIRKVNFLTGKYIGFKIKGKSSEVIREVLSAFKSILDVSNGIIESLRADLDSIPVSE